MDNTANTATYFLYNLSIRPEIQKKVYQEIKEVVSFMRLGILRYGGYFKLSKSRFTHPEKWL